VKIHFRTKIEELRRVFWEATNSITTVKECDACLPDKQATMLKRTIED